MTRNRILMTCAIASLALGLSACSSDDDGPMTMMPDTPAEGETQAVADAKMGVTTALADLGMAMTDRTAAHTVLQDAQAAVTAAGDALGTTDDPAGEVAAFNAAMIVEAAAQADYDVKTAALTDAQADLYAANMTLAEVAPGRGCAGGFGGSRQGAGGSRRSRNSGD